MTDEMTTYADPVPTNYGTTFLTMIVPVSSVDFARSLAASLDPGGVGMWTTALSPSGKFPATHFISTGYVQAAWQYITPTQDWEQDEDGNWTMVSSTPGNPVRIYEMCQAQGLSVTQAEIDALFTTLDFTQQDPWTACSRLGVKLAQPDDDATQEGDV